MPNTYLGSTTPLNVRRKKGVFFFFLTADTGKPSSEAQTRLIQANYGFVTGNTGIDSCWGDHLAEPSVLVGGCTCTNGSFDNVKLDFGILELEFCYSFNSVTDSWGAMSPPEQPPPTETGRNLVQDRDDMGGGGGLSADGWPCKAGREGEIGQREEPK